MTNAIRPIFAVFATAAISLSIAGCDSDGAKTPTTSPPSSMSASASASAMPPSPAPGQDDKLSLQLLDNLIQGEWSTVREHFDDTMKAKLSCDKLASAWSDYQRAFGSYQSHGDPEDVPRGDLTVVNVPLHMSQMPGQLRVTFHNDATVAGLFLLRTGVPVP